MQTRKHDNAFPIFDSDGLLDDAENYSSSGLTKREYFAAMALQGILSNPSLDPDDYDPAANVVLAIEAAEFLIIKLNESNGNRQ